MSLFFSLRTSLLLDYCKWVKQIFVTLLLVIIAPFIFGQSKHKNTWSTMQLKGNVKNIEVIEYNVNEEIAENFGEIQPSKKNSSSSIFFDSVGNTMEYNRYYGSGVLIVKNIYKYDSIGIAIEMNSFDERKMNINNTKFIRDTANNIIEKNIFNPNGSLEEKRTFKFDEKGNIIEEKHFDENDKLVFHLASLFDNRDRQIENKFFDSKGSLTATETCYYDKNDNIIEAKYSEPKKLETSKLGFVYEFDKNGNWIKRILYNKEVIINNQKSDFPRSITTRKIEYY